MGPEKLFEGIGKLTAADQIQVNKIICIQILS